jgi:hypothetical protein
MMPPVNSVDEQMSLLWLVLIVISLLGGATLIGLAVI